MSSHPKHETLGKTKRNFSRKISALFGIGKKLVQRSALKRYAVGLSAILFKRFSKVDFTKVYSPGLKDGVDKKTAVVIDETVDALRREANKIEALDRRIIQLQQSGRTSFKSLNRLHVYLSMRSKLYHRLHAYPYFSQLNISALLIFIISLSFSISSNYSNLFSPLPGLKPSVKYIAASAPEDTTIFTGTNKDLKIGFSNKDEKTVGANIILTSDRIPNAGNYQLSINLLADGLNVPAEKTLQQVSMSARQQVSQLWIPSNRSHTPFSSPFLKGRKDGVDSSPKLGEARWDMVSNTAIQQFSNSLTVHAEDSSQIPNTNSQLPSNTVANAEVTPLGDQGVLYKITDQISARYIMESNKVKEFITIKEKDALAGDSLSFALNSTNNFYFAEDPDKDGSWLAYREGDRDRINDRAHTIPVFRLYAPTAEDGKKLQGKITMGITNDRITYTIDQNFLNNANYPIVIDPNVGAGGVACTWQGVANANWATAGNWDCGHAPAANDDVIFDGAVANTTPGNGSAALVATGAVNNNIYDFIAQNNYNQTITFDKNPITGGTAGHIWDIQHNITLNQSATGGVTLVFTGDTTVNPTDDSGNVVIPVGCSSGTPKCGRGIILKVANDVTVASGAKISADGKGFIHNTGPGSAGPDWHAGTYGGKGWGTSAATYGDPKVPIALGSGGDQNGAIGGGAIRLAITGTLTQNGTISANGAAATETGSGGSIYISANSVLGNGTISANGGNSSNERSGGGGRVAIVASTNTHSGTVSAYCGTSAYTYQSGAGTVYKNTGGQTYGTLIVDNNNLVRSSYGTEIPTGQTWQFDNVTVDRKAELIVISGTTLIMDSETALSGGNGTSAGAITNRGTVTTSANFSISKVTFNANSSGTITGLTNLTIAADGVLSHSDNSTAETYKIDLTISGDLTVNGSINVDGLGYDANQGPNTACSNSCGGSYGGNGGWASTSRATYGSVVAPVNFGSGGSGSGSSGGGAIKLTVGGALANNGTISSNGLGADDPGAGGSVYLIAASMSGSGTITANGKSGQRGSGGGRISITATSSTYGGTPTAYGANGSSGGVPSGGAGTVYQNIGGTKTVALNNNGITSNAGTVLPETDYSGTGTWTVTNGAIITSKSNLSAVTATPDNQLNKVNLTLDALTVDSTGKINVDGKGYFTNQGAGFVAGKSTSSHGGIGYDVVTNNSYGSVTAPITLGSGSTRNDIVGGGAIILTVTGQTNIVTSGSISANGQGSSNSASCSGGSVFITTGTMIGGGTVSANGGVGSYGAGGGRIAVIITGGTSTGSVILQAYSGAQSGAAAGAGTVYVETRGSGTVRTLIVDNNSYSHSTSNKTMIPAGESWEFDILTIKNEGELLIPYGATLTIPANTTLSNSASTSTGWITNRGTIAGPADGNLTITKLNLNMDYISDSNKGAFSNVTTLTIDNGSKLSHSGYAAAKINFSVANLTILSGGSVNVEAMGYYRWNMGPGAPGASGGGGGYGGKGAGFAASDQGPTYGSSTAPTDWGSGCYNSNASGGGAVKLDISGTLTVNSGAAINANGTGVVNSVAASGGSIYLIVGTLTGSGNITANGGGGIGNTSSGGGGRIAIYVKGTDSGYSGSVTAAKGTGDTGRAYLSEAGTIVQQHIPAVTFSSPADSATNVSQNPTISFSATDSDNPADWYRMKIEIATDSGFTTNAATFTQADDTNSFNTGGYQGSYAGMNYNGGGAATLDGYTSGTAGTFTFTTALTQGVTYYTRLSSCDPGGACATLGQYSSTVTHSFTIAPIDKLAMYTDHGLQFTGSQQDIATSAASIPFSSNGTFSFWLKLPDLSNNYTTPLGLMDFNSGAAGIYLDAGGNPSSHNIILIPSGWATGSIAVPASDVDDGSTWSLWTFTFNGSQVLAYKNGQYVTSADYSSTNKTLAKLGYAAVTGNYFGNVYSGAFDDIRIYSRVLSSDEVSRLYSKSSVSGSGLSVWWRMNENYGQTVADDSGNSQTLTLGANTSTGSDDPAWLTSTVESDNFIAHNISSAKKVQLQNTLNEPVNAAADTTVNLSSTSSGTKYFCSDSACASHITQVTIPSGSSTASFYYYDEAVGTPTITAAESPSAGWTDATQQLTFTADSPYRIKLYISGSPTSTTPATALTGTITAYDQYGNTATAYTGDKSITYSGAANASAAPGGGTIYPTATDKTAVATNFGTATTTTFTSGVSSSAITILLKKTESISISITDGTLSDQSPTDQRYSIQVRPGNLDHYSMTDYPQAGTAQFATAGFPWNSTGLAGGSGAPYDPVVTTYDAYSNVKYDYAGPIWFTMDPTSTYVFPYDAASNKLDFTWSGNYADGSHDIRTATGDTYDNGRHIFSSSAFTVSTGGTSLPFYIHGKNGEVAITPTNLPIKIKPASLGALGIDYSPTLTTMAVDTAFTSDVIVTAYDVLGNVKTDYTGNVYFTSTDPSVTLPSTSVSKYTFQVADLGAKTFDKATFKFGTGGNHRITVTDDSTDPGTAYSDTSTIVVVPTHAPSHVSATAGHESVTLAWTNTTDAAVSKMNIYQSTTQGVLGTKLGTQPSVTPGTVSQYNVTGLTNNTTYYFTLKSVHLDPTEIEIESVASTQVEATPADIAPRNVTASQQTSGLIKIDYGLRYDSSVAVQYYNPTTSSWVNASTSVLSGDVGVGISGSEAITTHTLYYQIATDYPNQYFTALQGFKIKLLGTTNQGTGQSISNDLLLDTKPPHLNTGESAIVVDATGDNTATLTITAHEDGATEQAITYRLSNASDMSNSTNWANLSTKPTTVTGWDLGTSSTVYVQFRDPYNNILSASNAIIEVLANFGLKDGSNLESGDYRLLLMWTNPNIQNFSSYIIERSTNGSTYSQIDTTTKNAYVDVNLSQTTRYYYRVKTADTLGNISRPTGVLSSQPGAAPDVTALPTVTLQNWKQEYGVRATVTWTTDQLADSFVVYSKEPLESGTGTTTTAGTAAQVVGQFDSTLSHSVLVQQLEPSTKYYFKTLSQNEVKITGASDVVEVTTPERIPLTISSVTPTATTNTSTTMTWTTNKLSTTTLDYGTTTAYGSTKTETNQNTDHSIKLDNLSPGTTYHIRINAKDADDNTTVSDDYAVAIPPTPGISDLKIEDLKPNQATITWSTNVNADSQVSFGPAAGDYSSQQGKDDKTTLHSVTIIGLVSNTTYHYQVKSTDTYGNVATSSDASFTAPTDTTPPVISSNKAEVTTSGSGDSAKIMAIITWNTDEPSTSQVVFGQGIGSDYSNKTEEVTSFNMAHTVIIPDLKANASYQFQIISKDASGNMTQSPDQTIITPTKEKSLLQLVVKSLEETFSWTKRLKDSRYLKWMN